MLACFHNNRQQTNIFPATAGNTKKKKKMLLTYFLAHLLKEVHKKLLQQPVIAH